MSVYLAHHGHLRRLALVCVLPGFAAGVWIAKNVLLTGYPVYPSTIFPFPVDWRMGRVRALVALRAERAERRDRQGNVCMAAQEAGRSGKLVIEADNISVGYPGQPPLIRNFSTIIQRGDRVGLIGENGTGKTSLIRVLLGEQQPTEGEVRLGTNLEISYFDQLRETLDPEASVMRQRRSEEVLAGVLDRLKQYTVKHFATEEELFDRYGYAEAPAHKKAHRDLVEKVLAFEQELKNGRAKVTMEIMRFLKEWLVGHIMGTDKRYGPFLNGKGVQ